MNGPDDKCVNIKLTIGHLYGQSLSLVNMNGETGNDQNKVQIHVNFEIPNNHLLRHVHDICHLPIHTDTYIISMSTSGITPIASTVTLHPHYNHPIRP